MKFLASSSLPEALKCIENEAFRAFSSRFRRSRPDVIAPGFRCKGRLGHERKGGREGRRLNRLRRPLLNWPRLKP